MIPLKLRVSLSSPVDRVLQPVFLFVVQNFASQSAPSVDSFRRPLPAEKTFSVIPRPAHHLPFPTNNNAPPTETFELLALSGVINSQDQALFRDVLITCLQGLDACCLALHLPAPSLELFFFHAIVDQSSSWLRCPNIYHSLYKSVFLSSRGVCSESELGSLRLSESWARQCCTFFAPHGSDAVYFGIRHLCDCHYHCHSSCLPSASLE